MTENTPTLIESLKIEDAQDERLRKLARQNAVFQNNDALLAGISMGQPEALVPYLIYRNELTLLFADTNVGKTILAMQLANKIANAGRRVMYVDFEMNQCQINARYFPDDAKERFRFSDNFTRLTISPANIPDNGDAEKWLLDVIEGSVLEDYTEVLFIDNLTALCSSGESGDVAATFMRQMLSLRDRRNLTIVVLAHTPKGVGKEPLTVDTMAGSKKITSLADAVFAIGRSKTDESLRYLKQCKARNCEIKYGISNVPVYELVRDERTGAVMFDFRYFSHELTHLGTPDDPVCGDSDASNLTDEKIITMLRDGATVRSICRELKVGTRRVVEARRKVAELMKAEEQNQDGLPPQERTRVTIPQDTPEHLIGGLLRRLATVDGDLERYVALATELHPGKPEAWHRRKAACYQAEDKLRLIHGNAISILSDHVERYDLLTHALKD